jgi:heptaprenyl diphosphate synthase
MVFQIVDDILDITATDAELGKPAGHDMVEGVYTLPVMHTLAAGGPSADELRRMLGRPLNRRKQRRALDIVRSGNGVERAIATAREFVVRAESACDALPSTPATNALRRATESLLSSVVR